MKRILTILSIVIISLISCGCTQEKTDLCTSFKEIPYDYETGKGYSQRVSKEYPQQEYNYNMNCKIRPAISNDLYSNELENTMFNVLDKLGNHTYEIPEEHPYDNYYEVLKYLITNNFASIPQNLNKYNEIIFENKDEMLENLSQISDNYMGDTHAISSIKIAYEYLANKGYFKDYRVTDIFIHKLFRMSSNTDDFNSYEQIMVSCAKYNENNPKAHYTLKQLGGLLYVNENYYYKN